MINKKLLLIALTICSMTSLLCVATYKKVQFTNTTDKPIKVASDTTVLDLPGKYVGSLSGIHGAFAWWEKNGINVSRERNFEPIPSAVMHNKVTIPQGATITRANSSKMQFEVGFGNQMRCKPWGATYQMRQRVNQLRMNPYWNNYLQGATFGIRQNRVSFPLASKPTMYRARALGAATTIAVAATTWVSWQIYKVAYCLDLI